MASGVIVMLNLSSPVQYVRGVGAERARILENKGLLTAEDLLYHIPFRYEDRTRICGPEEAHAGEMATVIAEVVRAGMLPLRRSPLKIFRAVVERSGHRLNCKWFHASYLQRIIRPGQFLALYGKVEGDPYDGGLQMVQPEYEILPGAPGQTLVGDNSLAIGRIVPIYESAGAGRLTSRFFRRVIHFVLENLSGIEDPMPPEVAARCHLVPRWEAIRNVHFPPPGTQLAELAASRSAAHQRLIFEEFFFLESRLALKRKRAQETQGIAFRTDPQIRESLKRILPFHPTAAQKKALAEIAEDMRAPHPMQRLLQGEVGSGKTIVALQAAMIAMENGYQVAMMAPTEVLATQHFLCFRRLLRHSVHEVVLLSGSASAREKKTAKRLLQEGIVKLAVGTHALVEEDVEFSNLGLVIIDEQHRFGVVQRLRLMQKGRKPDTLVMTATPIPRTLALTLYGDLDVSVIGELPSGRKPILTRQIPEEHAAKAYEFVRSQVASGAQAFIIYPLIEDAEPGGHQNSEDRSQNERPEPSLLAVERKGEGAEVEGAFNFDTAIHVETTARRHSSGDLPRRAVGGASRLTKLGLARIERGIDRERAVTNGSTVGPKKTASSRKREAKSPDLKSALKMYEFLSKEIFPEFHLGILHGRLPAEEKERTMEAFQAGEIQILVGTTVVEVGVDVPNASVMVIEQAERFGLSQLHQLRGRVGRGKRQSYCLLLTSHQQTEAAHQRLATLERTNDGFEIAELDLRLRGPGEFLGTRQSGMPTLRVANLIRDREILEWARREASEFIEHGNPPDLDHLMNYIRGTWDRRYGLVNAG